MNTAFRAALPARAFVARAGLALSTAVAMGSVAAAGTTTENPSATTPIEQRLDDLMREVEALKAELKRMKDQAATPAVTKDTAAPSPDKQQPAVAAESPRESSPLENISLWGYGELYYTRPIHQPQNTQADLARAVFGIGYTFDDRTLFNSEYEVEHAVSSASDVGEFEVEQFYAARKLDESTTLDAGLFLMPFGLLNEHHEPTQFYGVQRNFVETLVIPSTWREGGLNLKGQTESGFGWNVGLTTGIDLSKWNFAPEFPLYTNALTLEDNDVAPLQATHQELALANASHLSHYVALDYTGVPGLALGAAIFGGNAASGALPSGNYRVGLWEAHARWNPGRLDLSALYAHGSIGNTAGANLANPGSPNPIPAAFDGYYGQAAYTVWQSGDYRLTPFARWERYNLGSRYEGSTGPVLPGGSVPLSATPGDYGTWPVNYDRVVTIGANYYLNSHVVVKLDVQRFQQNTNFDRVDLGLGLNF